LKHHRPQSLAAVSFLSVLLFTLRTAPACADDSARIDELERKVDVLTRELADSRGMPSDTARAARPALRSQLGFAPAASKVYGAEGVSVGGYGEMLFEDFDRTREDDALSGTVDRIDFLRQVLYFGYAFDDRLHFNSEVELEHAGVKDEAEVQIDPTTGAGEAELSGEVNLEFAYVDWRLNDAFGVRGGMMLVPIGLTNEQHEPPVFLGARRPEVEQVIIPTTWSGNGVGIFGESNGMSWRGYVMEGLDGARFSAPLTIREGRSNGSQAPFVKPAFAGRFDVSRISGLTLGVSAYTGEAWQGPQPTPAGIHPRVFLFDVHGRLEWRGVQARGLWVSGQLDDAAALSDVIGLAGSDRLGERFFGGYLEAGYDVLAAMRPGSNLRLVPYARYERLDTQEDVTGGVEDPANDRKIVTLGAAFAPHPQVVVKLDRQERRNEANTGVGQWNVALGYLF